MGALTVPQMFEVMLLKGFDRYRKYMELSSKAPNLSPYDRAYHNYCRLIFAHDFMGRGLSKEEREILEIMKKRMNLERQAVMEVVYIYGLCGIGSPSMKEDFLVDLWARRQIASMMKWPLDELTPEWEEWIATFSVYLSEKFRNTQTMPELPKAKIQSTGSFDPATPFPDEVPF